MARRLTAAVLLVALSTACATPHAVRLDTGEGAPREYRPRTEGRFVEVSADAFEDALARLVLDAPLTLRSSRQGGLVLAAHSGDDADARWRRLMGKGFGGLCKAGQRGGHCLSLLDDVMGLSEWDKLGLALSLSLEPMKESISRAVEDTLAPQLFCTVIATGLVTWAVLAANPEPVFTKAAAVVSALMLAYLGVETFLAVVDASRELKRATDRATRPEELEQDRCSHPWYRDSRDQIHPMNIHDALEAAQKRWLETSTSSDVGLWWIADDVRQLRPGASEDEIRKETLRALRPLLTQGSLRAARLLPRGSYQLWEGSVEEQLAKLDAEWAALGRPPDIGDIVWFIGAR